MQPSMTVIEQGAFGLSHGRLNPALPAIRRGRRRELHRPEKIPPRSGGSALRPTGVNAWRGRYFGSRTVSITWITPFDCSTSAIVTVAASPLASVTESLPAAGLLDQGLAAADGLQLGHAVAVLDRLHQIGGGETTRHHVIGEDAGERGLVLGLHQMSRTVPAGSLANAALVGANTVNGPAPDSVSTRPAAFTAATSVV